MPTYDYECQACGHRFELFQSMSAKVRRKCPDCGKPRLERLIGPGAGFLFKGDGFYITDYRSASYKAGQKADEPSKGTDKAADGSSGSSESKPESKSADAPAKSSAKGGTEKKSKGSSSKRSA